MLSPPACTSSPTPANNQLCTKNTYKLFLSKPDRVALSTITSFARAVSLQMIISAALEFSTCSIFFAVGNRILSPVKAPPNVRGKLFELRPILTSRTSYLALFGYCRFHICNNLSLLTFAYAILLRFQRFAGDWIHSGRSPPWRHVLSALQETASARHESNRG